MKTKPLFMKKLNTGTGTKWHKRGKSVFMSHSLNKGTYNITYIQKDHPLNDWKLGLYMNMGVEFAPIPSHIKTIQMAINYEHYVLPEGAYKSFITNIPLNSQIVYQTDYVDINLGRGVEIPYKIDIPVPYIGIIEFWKAVEKRFGLKYFSNQTHANKCSLEGFNCIHWMELIFQETILNIETVVYDMYDKNGRDFLSILNRYGANINTQSQYNIRIVFIVCWMLGELLNSRSAIGLQFDKTLTLKYKMTGFMANKRIPVVDWVVRMTDDSFYRNFIKPAAHTYKITPDMMVLYTRAAYPELEGVVKFMCGFHPWPLVYYGLVTEHLKSSLNYISTKYPSIDKILNALRH